MATCDSLQPVVLLTDLMDSSAVPQTEIICSSRTEKETSSSHLFEMEQTEPLNLCLNGSTLKHSSKPGCRSKDEESEDLSEQSDDDVIFVKTYKVDRKKLAKKPYCVINNNKGEPRRNPIRKARDTKRFQEYTDIDFLVTDLLNESGDEENVEDLSEKYSTRHEDSEDWKIEDIPKKSRQRRRVFSRKITHKMGRKKKINKIVVEEKKVPLADLTPLIQANLLLIKDYVSDLRTIKTLVKEEHLEHQDAVVNAVNLFKQQVVLLSVTKDTTSDDLPKLINEWTAS